MSRSSSIHHIAIVGMGCIFPQSRNLKEYWHLIFNNQDAIQDIPADTHWKLKDYFDKDPGTPDHTYCTRGGFLPEITFDPLAYGIPPNNLEATDTSQLLGLEVARMALEDAGYPIHHPVLKEKKVNVILGVTGTQELVIPLGARLGHPIWKKALTDSGIDTEKREEILERISGDYVRWQENSFPGLLGNVVAGRIANRLNLSGTNSVSDAACASSLSAIHTAAMELNQGKCDISITGGVDTLNDIFMHMCFSKTGVLSHTSDARPFSKDADGTVLGEGIGMLVLKRLDDAQKDNDRIYAVIKGIGTSSDGRTSAVYAPEARGQVKALKEAYAEADVDPASVRLIEAHGTGTRVGDKVEFTALKQCFEDAPEKNRTAIGSVKSMIGHTKAAAGAAGIIKTALALYNKAIPGTLKAEEPDPELDINPSPFYLNHQTKPWVTQAPRRSGISAFGFGGSNFHAVLEEYTPDKDHVSWDGSTQIIAFSSHLKTEVIKSMERFRSLVNAGKDEPEIHHLIAFHAHKSRQNFQPAAPFRLALVYKKDQEINEVLDNAIECMTDECSKEAVFVGSTPNENPKIGFLFPGQGSQYTGMGKELITLFPEALETMNQAAAIFSNEGDYEKGARFQDFIFPLPDHVQSKKESEETLRKTDIAQPSIGAVSMAMDKILKRFNIAPQMTCGHSFGELSALYSAGWLDDTSFISLAVSRGRYMARAGNRDDDPGSMLAVQAPLEEIDALIKNEKLDLVLANRNSPNQGVLSGATPEILKAGKICRKQKIRAVQLPVAAAFHSKRVENAVHPFINDLKSKAIAATSVDVLSNTSGECYPKKTDQIKQLLGNQLANPVRFVDNIEAMIKKGITTFIEVGPKTVLTGLAKSILSQTDCTLIAMDASCGKKSGPEDLALVLCRLAAKGFPVDLSQWEDKADLPEQKKMRIPLTGANPKPKNRCTRPKSSPQPVSPVTDQISDKTVKAGEDPPSHSAGVRPTQDQPALTDIKTTDSQTQNRLTGRKGSDMTSQHHPPVNNHPPAAPHVYEAMKMVQKGLEAMQQLQIQTARTHEKFLETQAQASSTLANMLAHTQALAYPGTNEHGLHQHFPTADHLPSPVTPEPPSAPKAATPPVHGNQASEQDFSAAPPEPHASSEENKAHANDSIAGAHTNREEAPGRPEAAAAGSGKTEEILFDIVSTLTGFPVEMLEPDMDIESDLGIDSIKKVEIISELEKQLPACDGLTTETIGTVRTLNDICRTIDDQAVLSMPESVSEAGASSKTTQPAPPADGEGINKTPSATVANILFNTISELTGFPVEMLEPDMNLESDLGIDSIKRVEILSKLEQELDHIHSVSSDEIAGLKTIKEIVSHLEPAPQDTGPESKKKNPESEPDLNISLPGSQSREKKTADDEKTDSKQSVRPLIRQKVRLEVFPTNQIRFYNGARIDLPPGKKVYITRDSVGIAEAFQHEFLRSNINAGLISLGGDTIPDLPDAAGIVLIPDGWNDRPGLDNALDFLKSSLMLVKQNAGYLMESAGQKGAFLTGISFLGGGFGFSNTAIGCNPVYGGIAGLIKTAAIEFRDVLCRVLDLPGSKEECLKNIEAATALMMTQGAVEMGLDGDSCNIPTLVDQEAETGEIDLGRDDVIVITGGAKGVTAACAIELAQRFSPTLILIGRSDISAEPEWAEGIDDPGSLKKAILSHEFEGRRPKPTDIERVYQTILSGREIRQNIKSMEDRGSIVRYIRADIRDRDEVKTVFKMIEKEFKPVTAVIHGAGVKNDKFIVDKDPVACSRVLGTKIEGLNALLSAARNNSLKYLILFSSIAARTGNQGQSDYAMANEALNKWAQQLAFDHPRMTTLSVNWGPWEGGMVDASLQKEFVRRGIDLIPLKTGARQLMIEMRDTRQTDPEVVIGGLLSPASKIKPRKLSKAMSLVCGPISFPILNAHKIDNEPVVPFALLMEYHAHAAVKNNPGLIFTGMDHMRLLKGVVTRNDEIELAIHLGKCQSDKTGYTASGSISSENENGRQFIHSTCSILLNDRLPKPPVLSEAAFMSLKPYPVDVEKAYETYLFHGRPMQSIIAINGYSETGIEVVTKRSPSPDQWIDSGSISKWTIEPMMLDAAFQAAILWSVEELGQACLPSFLANLRLYSSFPDSTGNVRILFTVNEKTKNRIKGYFTFLNEADVVVASITGFEAVTDPSLGEKFKNAPLFSRESILAFAQGNPSDAFGEPYKIFDRDREIARLPRPPYFFMDRVVSADHPQWEMAPGGWIEAQYDLPENEWYFSANRSDTLPFCILLEIALQPCGWLAAYSGSALQSPDRLHFRNLGGRAHFIKPINRKSGTLTIRTRMTDLSKAGGMIIQDFDMEVIANGERVYAGTTNFGFFTDQALSNQVGIRSSEFSGYRLPDHMPFTTHTFKADAPLTPFDKNTSRDSGMPAKALLMFDQIDLLSFDAGLYNNGYVKAVKTVDPDEWFFHAHFYQDPVCPGSLGVESFLQMLRFFMIEKYQINPTDYSAGMPMDHTHEWIYRGQIIPENKQVEIHAHIRQCNQSENSFAVTADGALVVDGICIYEMKNFAAGFDRINAVVSGIDPNQLSEKNK